MTIEESRALAVAKNSLRFNPDLDDIEEQSLEIILTNMMDRMQDDFAPYFCPHCGAPMSGIYYE